MRTLLLVNPSAGRPNYLRTFLPRVLQVFDRHGLSYELVQTRHPGHATEIVRRHLDRVDSVTVFGGDGTVREAVHGFGETAKPLGVIPFGTVNVLALELGIPFDPVRAAQVVLEGRTRLIDVGVVNDEPFLLMVSTGLDAMAVHRVNPAEKSLLGRWAYILAALRSLFVYHPRPVEIRIPDSGVTDEGYLAVVSNSRFYGGPFELHRDTTIDDGILDILLFKRGSVIDTFRLFLGVLAKTHTAFPDVAFHKARRLLLLSRKKVLVQVDGDKAPSPPLAISIRPRFLPVFVPAEPHTSPISPRGLRRLFRRLLREARRTIGLTADTEKT